MYLETFFRAQILNMPHKSISQRLTLAWKRAGELYFSHRPGSQVYLIQAEWSLLTFEDVLKLVLLQAGTHGLFYGWDVLVQFDHQRVVVHALHIRHNGIIALLGQGDQVMETMHPGLRDGK